MQKLSETLYSGLFWLISGLVVWLVIVPVALICFPIIILLKAVGLALFKMPQSHVAAVERNSHTSPERQSDSAVESLLTSLLLTTLVEVPAFLAAIISLQPARLIQKEQLPLQTFQPHPPQAPGQLSTDATNNIEISASDNSRYH